MAAAAVLVVMLALGAAALVLLSGGKKEEPRNGSAAGNTVPALKGMTLEEARALLEAQGLEYQVKEETDLLVEKGKVIRTSPDEGQPLAGGVKLTVLVSAGPPENARIVALPDLYGMGRDEAVAALQAAGFNIAPLAEANNDEVPGGCVCSQDPPPGASYPEGTTVTLVISLGPSGPQWVTCTTCGGSGRVTCPTCGGSGRVTTTTTCPSCGGSGVSGTGLPCPTCGGSGRVTTTTTCSRCGGSGKITCPTCGGKGKVAR